MMHKSSLPVRDDHHIQDRKYNDWRTVNPSNTRFYSYKKSGIQMIPDNKKHYRKTFITSSNLLYFPYTFFLTKYRHTTCIITVSIQDNG